MVKSEKKILIVDDGKGMGELLSYEMKALGYQSLIAKDAQQAILHVEKEKYQILIGDIDMPRMNGFEMLERVKEVDPQVEVILTAENGSVEMAVESMKKGAYDFVLKPFNMAEMKELVEKAIEKNELKALVALYEASKALFSTMHLDELFEIVMDLIKRVLKADECSLMLVGEDQMLSIVASRGIPQELAQSVHLKIGERISGLAAKEKRDFLLINGLEGYPDLKRVQDRTRPINSSIVCPLMDKGKVLGVLNVSRTTNDENYNSTDLHSASIFAAQVALAIQNAKLYESLESKLMELETSNKSLKEAQDQLLQSEKLASIGLLVSGVAHEINNPLTAVIGYTQLLMDSDASPNTQKQLKTIFDQAQRCGRIVQDLLLFARKRKPNSATVNLVKILEESIRVTSQEIKIGGVEIHKKYATEDAMVDGDEHQLQQVFVNMITNACQALRSVSGKRSLEIEASKSDDFFNVIIRDNGPGILKENRSKVFDPFFTTKEVGSGTGLGLSLCYGIIKEHSGTIGIVDSEKGACFRIELPLAKKRIKPTVEAVNLKPAVGKFGKGKNILLVEDESSIRGLLNVVLADKGFEIDTASTGEIALEKIKEQPYDIIICDYRIPQMNGLELYENVKKSNPNAAARFLFVSGSITFGEKVSDFLEEEQLPYIAKPFTSEDLLRAVDGILKDAA